MPRKKNVKLTEKEKAVIAANEEFNLFIKKTGISNPVTAAYILSLDKRIAVLEELKVK